MAMSDLPKRGDRIRLLHTNDPYTKLRPGAEGTVTRVTVSPWEGVGCHWDSGSSLTLIPEEGDRYEVISRC